MLYLDFDRDYLVPSLSRPPYPDFSPYYPTYTPALSRAALVIRDARIRTGSGEEFGRQRVTMLKQ